MKKVVVNRPFGGFHLPIGFAQKYHFESIYDYIERDDPRLVEYIEEHPNERGGLEVVTFDSGATDWEILEYDGSEEIIAIFNGIIHHL